MANNDFFVKFDSNAVAWSRALEQQLKPARDQVAGMQKMLNDLNRMAEGTPAKVQRALAAGLPAHQGGGPASSGAANEVLANINRASDELGHVINQLETVVRGLRSMPQVVGNVMRGIQTSVNNLQQQQSGQGRSFAPGQPNRFVQAGTPGALQHGTAQAAVFSAVNRAVRSGQISLTGGPSGRPSIAGVTNAQIDRAQIDRIVNAIERQTAVLQNRFGSSSGGAPTNVVSSRGGKAVPQLVEAASKEVGNNLEDLYKELDDFETMVAANMKRLAEVAGPKAVEAIAAMRQQTDAQRAQIRAQIAEMERGTGTTRAEQSAARRAAAEEARRNRPTFTDDQMALINSPADPNFLSQIGRGRGQYSKADLKRMADALTEAGFPVSYGRDTKNEVLGSRLVEARRQFGQQYPEGVNVSRTTKISDQLSSILGDLERGADIARERQQQREILRANALSGGDVGDPIHGRRLFGSAFFDGPTPLTRAGTPAEVLQAERLLRSTNPEMELAMRHARSASFSPYDPGLSAGIRPGNTPEERLRAEGARLMLRGLRQSTAELDRMGGAFEKLAERLQRNRNFIEETQASLLAGGPGDENELRRTRAENERIMRAMSRLGADGRAELFQSPEYRAGRARREQGPWQGVPFVYDPATRSAYEERVARAQGPRTLADNRIVQDATMQAVAGIRTALRSREIIRNIPGLTVRGNTLTSTEGLSREDQAALTQATRQLTSAQNRTFSGRSRGDVGPAMEREEQRLENAAVHFANTIARLFNGLSPRVEDLIGREIRDQENAASEARRRTRHENAILTDQVRQQNTVSAAGSGGRGGGGAKPPVAGGAADDGRGSGRDRDILGRILAKLNDIHGTLKSGIRVTGNQTAGETSARPSTSRAATATRAELAAAVGDDPAARQAAIAAQRARMERLRGSDIDRAHAAALAERDRRQRALTETTTRSAAAERAQYRELQRTAAAMQLLSRATQEEITALQRMNSAGATAQEIARQQSRVYASLRRDLQFAPAQLRDNTAYQVLNNTGPRVTRTELDDIKRSVGFMDVGEDWGEQMAMGAQHGFASVFGRQGFWGRVLGTTGTFIIRNFAAGAVFGATNALQDTLDQAIQTEATFVRVSAALESTGKDIGNLRGDLQNISTDYGVQLNDVYQTAAGLAGLFDNATDLAAGTRVVAQLQTISGGALNATEAMGVLASTMSAFQRLPGEDISDKVLPDGIQGVQHIADVLTVVQNTLGTNIETSAEGVSRLSGLAREMRLSFEETAVFTAQIAKQTNQTGAAAGEQFSRILSALQTGRGRSAVQEAFGAQVFAVDENGAIDYGQTLQRMIAGWDGLSDAQKRNVIVSVAGQRQAAAFNALMNNGTKTLNTLARAQDANGDAAERMDALMRTLNKQLDVLRTNAQNLASNLVRSGILNILGVVLVTANSVLGVINDLLTAFNDLADNNKLLGWLRDFVTLMIGAGVAIKLVQASARGIRGALAAITPETMVAARAQAGAGGVARPAYGTYGRGGFAAERPGRAPLSRFIGFGLDRTVGIAGEAGSRSIVTAGRKLEESGNRFARGAGIATRRFGEGLTTVSTGIRSGFQSLGSGGLVTGFLDRRAGGLADRASGYRSRAAELRAIYADQQRYSSYGGPTAAANQANMRARLLASGLDDAQITARMQAPNEGLLRTADNLDRVGRVADAASRGTSRVSGAFSRIARSGALADGAIIGVTVAIAALADAMQYNKQVAEDQRRAYETRFGADRGKTADQAAQDAYIGPANESFTQRWEEFQRNLDSDSFFDQMGVGFQGLGQVLAGGPEAWFGGPSAWQRQWTRAYGTSADGKETFGLSAAQDALNQGMADLNELQERGGVTGEEYRRLAAQYEDNIASMMAEIEQNKGFSAAQKLAAQSNLEQAGKILSDQITDLASVADGLHATMTMTAEQIQRVQEVAQTAASVNGQTSLYGLDLSPLFEELIKDTGASAGSQTEQLLRSMTNGNDDPVDRAIANRRLLREEIIQLQNQWIAKLKQDPEQADAIRGQLLAAVQQFGQASDSVIQAITDNASLIAGQQQANGNFSGAMQTYAQAMRQADREYERQTRAVKNALDATNEAYSQIMVNAQQLSNLLGGQDYGALGGLLGGPLTNPTQGIKKPKLPSGLQEGVGESPWSFMLGDFQPPASEGPNQAEEKKGNAARRRHNAAMAALFQAAADLAIFNATKDITLQIAATADAGLRAALESQKAGIINNLTNQFNQGKDPTGTIPKGLLDFGNLAIDPQELLNAQVEASQAQVSADAAAASAADQAKADAAEARQNAAALAQARLGVAAAYADARGDAVAAARVQVRMAAAAMAAARADLAAATTASESAQARIAILSAQAQLIAAHAAVRQAQTDLVRSQYDVSIAIAEAAGRNVEAARRTLAQARAVLRAELKRSHGKATAEVNAAKAEAIRAEAALRDARLQDDLDTIDFNLQMGRITQVAAIHALQDIIKARDLTKEQRRQLLLQIKGMKDELADSQWNFGDIKLPTPYEMRRYIKERRQQFSNQLDAAAGTGPIRRSDWAQGGASTTTQTTTIQNQTTIYVDGAETEKVKRIIRDVVGRGVTVRTTGARRGR